MSQRNPVKGICLDMCPRREREMREKNKLLHVFEMTEGSRNSKIPKADRNKTVKQFARSAAGQRVPQPDDIRPPVILYKTMFYLVQQVIPRMDVKYNVVYDYVNDRIQSIRQDLILQMTEDIYSIKILEAAIRFYAISYFKLFAEPLMNFDPYLHKKELLICLKRLLHLYEKLGYEKLACENRDEFVAAYCLQNLGCTQTLNYILLLAQKMEICVWTNQAIKLSFAFTSGNFYRLFKILNSMPLFLVSVAFQHLESVRYQAFQVICKAFSSKQCKFPIGLLCSWLKCCSENNVKIMCKHFNITFDELFIHFQAKNLGTEVKPLELIMNCVYSNALSSINLRDFFCMTKECNTSYK